MFQLPVYQCFSNGIFSASCIGHVPYVKFLDDHIRKLIVKFQSNKNTCPFFELVELLFMIDFSRAMSIHKIDMSDDMGTLHFTGDLRIFRHLYFCFLKLRHVCSIIFNFVYTRWLVAERVDPNTTFFTICGCRLSHSTPVVYAHMHGNVILFEKAR